ncbi:hypothetical protein, conserved [Plasmodium gonderi]|uniref:Protein arginine N-methyltransferase domain-containing protein n=1 Tax=Plasmodium gonderi TaxID=77519 RepID=A0A1Y1JST0_PLAGO|nr:hypothetical protein, conserved [Plasmodium gonderi]GAW83483.1 hypothetical protein, conserved [Plasmodium gonderi]
MDTKVPKLLDLHLQEHVKNIIEGFTDESTSTTKDTFFDDKYAYSLIDNYKSRRTKNVVIHMLRKDINILHYNEEYKNIIFINFLRLCQLNNLNVKKYHDIFLEYDIFSFIVNSEKYVNFFLKPIINNDKLLWDVNKDHFEIFNFTTLDITDNENRTMNTTDMHYQNSCYVLEENLKLKLNDLVEDSSDCDSSLFSEDDISVASEFSEKLLPTSNYKMNSDNLSDHCKNSKSNQSLLEEYSNATNIDVVNNEHISIENKISNKHETLIEDLNNIPNIEQDEKKKESGGMKWSEHFGNRLETVDTSTLNNINLNHLIDIIVETGKVNHEDTLREGNNYLKKNSLHESIIEKFVKKSENENIELYNLHKKINSMEKIIKHLMSEIMKRDIIKKGVTENAQIGEIQKPDGIQKRKEIFLSTFREIECTHGSVVNSTDKESGDSEEGCDNKYFESYNDTSIHRTMILDKSRTNCYYEFIKENKEIFQNKVVLDIGCGSSIISLFCSDHAKIVVGIDNAHRILKKARKITEMNEAKNIYLFEGKLEENDIYTDEKGEIYYISKKDDIEKFKKNHNIKELKILKFDIIISEWMGYFLFYECMINTILYARDLYLKEGGFLFPNKIYLYLAGYNDLDYVNENILIWDSPLYDKDLSELKPDCKSFMENAKVISLDKNKVSTEVVNYAIIDMYTYSKNENLYIHSNFKVALNYGKVVTSLCFYFDCHFEPLPFSASVSIHNSENISSNLKTCTNTVLTTSMFKQETHWKQVLLHIHCPNYNIANISPLVDADKTNELCGNIYITSSSEHSRSINVLLQIKKNKSINVDKEWTCCYSLN